MLCVIVWCSSVFIMIISSVMLVSIMLVLLMRVIMFGVIDFGVRMVVRIYVSVVVIRIVLMMILMGWNDDFEKIELWCIFVNRIYMYMLNICIVVMLSLMIDMIRRCFYSLFLVRLSYSSGRISVCIVIELIRVRVIMICSIVIVVFVML